MLFRSDTYQGAGTAMYTFEELRPQLDTGDLVLFAGDDGISTGIKLLTGGDWSHLGMVLHLARRGLMLLFESAVIEDARNPQSVQVRHGVQVSHLRARIACYEGDVAVRRLDVERTPVMCSALRGLRRELRGRPFERSYLQLFKSFYDGPFGKNRPDLSSIFCSELVAEAYQRMGLLAMATPSNEYTPRDFSANSGLRLLKGRLGPELFVRKFT